MVHGCQVLSVGEGVHSALGTLHLVITLPLGLRDLAGM